MENQTVKMAMSSPINPNHLIITKEATGFDLKVVMFPINIGSQHIFLIQELKNSDNFHIVGAANYVGESDIIKFFNTVEQPIDSSIDCFYYVFKDKKGNAIESNAEAIRTFAMKFFGTHFDESCVYGDCYKIEKERFLSTAI